MSGKRSGSKNEPRARVVSGGGRKFSPERFRAVAMTILAVGDVDPRHLYDAMFVADMEAYRQLGKSITGTTWVKTAQGVEPRKPRRKRKPKDSTAPGASLATGASKAAG